MSRSHYDIAIIGAGSAGLTAAAFARQLGSRVALIEREKVGGDCTWTGCVPSKALLRAAKVAHEVRICGLFGIEASAPTTDMRKVREYVRNAIQSVYRLERPETLRESGIDVILGEARFVDDHVIGVNGTEIESRYYLIATGAQPRTPGIRGLDSVPYMTYKTVFDLDRLPESMIIIGSGPIGIEMAQAFQRFGTAVTVVGPALLPRDEPEVRQVLQPVLEREGVRFIWSAAESVARDDAGIVVRTGADVVKGEVLLVATGRRPSIAGLDLEKAGIAFSESGIPADEYLRTNVKHIYAAGDVIGGPQFTHYAGWQGFQAVRNALLVGNSEGMTATLPWVTFTDPEAAHVGLQEEQARKIHGEDVSVHMWPLDHVDRAVCENDIDGFIKVIALGDGKILGATIVAGRAGEMITEFTLALQNKLKLRDLAGAIHPYPTYATPIQQLAAAATVSSLLESTSGKLFASLSKLVR